MNREEERAYAREYYHKNKDKWQSYYNSNKAEILAKKKIQRMSNRPFRLVDLRERHQKLKVKVLAYYSNSDEPHCLVCGESRLPCLTIDHIHGNGVKHRKEVGVGGGSNMYRWLIRENFPEGFQTLCMNCQMVKKMAENECHRAIFEELSDA